MKRSTTAAVLVGAALVVMMSEARASLVIDDFTAPDNPRVVTIGHTDPDPTLVETSDAAILGGERDLLLDVIGTPAPISLAATIGDGTFVFNSISPGSVARIQYDGVDTDPVGPPAALANAEGLASLDLTAAGSMLCLDFLHIEGGFAATTDIEIEVHSAAAVALYSGTIADSALPSTYCAPFASFSNPSVLAGVMSIEVRINPAGAADVDFSLDRISVDVPEPATMILLGAGLAAMMARRRRRQA